MGSNAAIGSVLGGRYHLVSVLGTGSMSTVYRAQRDDGEQVAVKVLKRKIHNPQAATERLFREARVIARLDHPGCVKVLDWGVDDGQPFVVLELMEGEALNEAIKRWKVLDAKKAVAIMIPVCDVLEAAHALGVVHRDLKPGNIMLLGGQSGVQVKVLDFGLARVMPKKSPDETQPKELTRPGSTLGTPSYMAPEQVRGSRVDGRADVYAAGVILYELVSGTLPIIGETAIDTMLRQATDKPRPIEEAAPKLDPAVAALIMRCLEKSPDARYQSAMELKQALIALGEPVSHPDATTTFVREELPLEATKAKPPPKRLPKPKAPPSRSKRPPPKPEPPLLEVDDDDEAHPTTVHARSDVKDNPVVKLPLPMPPMSKVQVTSADHEATKLHVRPEPDLSEMEVTIPAHGPGAMRIVDEEHDFERTIPVTSLASGSMDRATELHDMADWASTQKIKRVREEDLDLPDATRPMRIKVDGPPPSRPSRPRSSAPAGTGSMRPPDPSFPPPPRLPSMRRPETSQAALNEVLSGIPNDERRWLLGAAIAGVAMAVVLAVWLLL